MKSSFKLKPLLLLVIVCLISSVAWGQMEAPKKKLASPRDSVSGTENGADISINYGSPSVKKRKIWGGLVPYGQVWRTGANEATRFTTSKDIMVEGKALPAGTYGFFAIPSETQWTIIFNSIPNQWGAFKYDSTKDVLRVMVMPKKAGKNEHLHYKINSKGFTLVWAKLAVPVKVN
jgi:hypothetical protein